MAEAGIPKRERSKSRAVGARCVGFSLRRASRILSQLYDEALRETGLRITQFSALSAIRSQSPVTVSALAERLATDRTTLSRNLRPLERDGLVRIDPGEDRRERVVQITHHGREALERAHPHWLRAQRRVEHILGGERLERVLDDLRTLVEGAGSQ